jgi:hypothetical protein
MQPSAQPRFYYGTTPTHAILYAFPVSFDQALSLILPDSLIKLTHFISFVPDAISDHPFGRPLVIDRTNISPGMEPFNDFLPLSLLKNFIKQKKLDVSEWSLNARFGNNTLTFQNCFPQELRIDIPLILDHEAMVQTFLRKLGYSKFFPVLCHYPGCMIKLDQSGSLHSVQEVPDFEGYWKEGDYFKRFDQ